MTSTLYIGDGACRYVVSRVRASRRTEDHTIGEITAGMTGTATGRIRVLEAPGTTDGTSTRHHLSSQDDASQYAYSNRKTATTTVDGGHRPLGALTMGLLTPDGVVYSHSIWRVDRRGHGSSQNNGKATAGKPRKARRINAAAALSPAEKQKRYRALAKWRKAAMADGYVCPEHGAPVECGHPCREQALALHTEGTTIVDTGPETWATKN